MERAEGRSSTSGDRWVTKCNLGTRGEKGGEARAKDAEDAKGEGVGGGTKFNFGDRWVTKYNLGTRGEWKMEKAEGRQG